MEMVAKDHHKKKKNMINQNNVSHDRYLKVNIYLLVLYNYIG